MSGFKLKGEDMGLQGESGRVGPTRAFSEGR